MRRPSGLLGRGGGKDLGSGQVQEARSSMESQLRTKGKRRGESLRAPARWHATGTPTP